MSTLSTITKRIATLEKELTGLRAAELALGGKPRKTAAPAKAKKTAVRKAKARKQDAPKASKAKRAPAVRGTKRAVRFEHLETIYNAIGERLPAIELKGKIDGRVLRALPYKAVIARLRKDGCITAEGERRQLVYIRTGALVKPEAPKAEAAPATEPDVTIAEA
jgi:hypothetical protein